MPDKITTKHLKVYATPGVHTEKIKAAFQQNGIDIQPADLASPQHSDFTLLLFSRPEAHIIDQMQNGISPLVSLDSWVSTGKAMLELNRSMRNRVFIADADTALLDTKAFAAHTISLLKNQERSPLYSPSKEKQHATSQANQESPLHVIAAQAVQQSEIAQNILAELCASSTTTSTAVLPLQVDLEKAFTEVQRLQQSAEHRNKIQEQQEKITELEMENSSLISHMHIAQEKAEKLYQTGLKTKKKLTQNKKKLQSVYRSKSWKITRPLRVLLRLLTGKPLRTRKS
ncbi:hypothetical protein [Desulfurispira natronophila]|uniref:Uncharacterized protein n=1 Tax=Desulfurispira natronophila TaxID=682562 RepID=A0A7W7Y698_9BACT|nr:hypothetical protein [Desulfurispira natronophila]MBB5022838.1 hypothetical protein [Desulfurispira natronophila]